MKDCLGFDGINWGHVLSLAFGWVYIVFVLIASRRGAIMDKIVYVEKVFVGFVWMPFAEFVFSV